MTEFQKAAEKLKKSYKKSSKSETSIVSSSGTDSLSAWSSEANKYIQEAQDLYKGIDTYKNYNYIEAQKANIQKARELQAQAKAIERAYNLTGENAKNFAALRNGVKSASTTNKEMHKYYSSFANENEFNNNNLYKSISSDKDLLKQVDAIIDSQDAKELFDKQNTKSEGIRLGMGDLWSLDARRQSKIDTDAKHDEDILTGKNSLRQLLKSKGINYAGKSGDQIDDATVEEMLTIRRQAKINDEGKKRAQAHEDATNEYKTKYKIGAYKEEEQQPVNKYANPGAHDGAGAEMTGQQSHFSKYVGATYLNDLTDDDKAIIQYLEKKGDKDAIKDYVAKITDDLEYKHTMKMTEEAQKSADRYAFLSSLASMGTNVASVVGILGGINDLASGNGIDTYSKWFAPARYTKAVRDTVTKNLKANYSLSLPLIGNVAAFAYQTGMSAADCGLMFVISAGAAQAVGAVMGAAGMELSTLQLNSITSNIMNVAIGSQVATQKVIELKERGLDDGTALTVGLVEGAVEGLTEKWSIERIMRNPSNFARAMARSFGAEGSEESVGAIVDPIVEVIGTKGNNEYTEQYNKYVAEGMSHKEALAKVIGEVTTTAINEGIAGGLSGMLMGATNIAMNSTKHYINSQGRAKQYIQDGQTMTPIEQGRAYTGETKQEKKAANYAGQLLNPVTEQAEATENTENTDNQVTRRQLAKQIRLNDKADIQVNAREVASQVEDNGGTEQSAEAIRKALAGENITREDAKNIKADRVALATLSDVAGIDLSGASLFKVREIASMVGGVSYKRGSIKIDEAEAGEFAQTKDKWAVTDRYGQTGDISNVEFNEKSGDLVAVIDYGNGREPVKIPLNEVNAVNKTAQKVINKAQELYISNIIDFDGVKEFIMNYDGKTSLAKYTQDAVKIYDAVSKGISKVEAISSAKYISPDAAKKIYEAAESDASEEGDKKRVIREKRYQEIKEKTIKRLEHAEKQYKRDKNNIRKMRNVIGDAKKIASESKTIKVDEAHKEEILKYIEDHPDVAYQIVVLNDFLKDRGIKFNLTYKGEGNSNGMYFTGDNSVTVAVDAEGDMLLRTAGHELTHWMKANNIEGYNELAKVVMDFYVEEGELTFEDGEYKGDLIESQKEILKHAFTSDGRDNGLTGIELDAYVAKKLSEVSNEALVEEIVANSCFDVLGNKDVVKNLSTDLKSRLLRFIHEVLDAISRALSIYADIEYYGHEIKLLQGKEEQLNKIRDAFIEGMAVDALNGTTEDVQVDIVKEGEEAKNSFASENAATANKTKLKKAKQMEEAGESMQTIYEQTGWFKSYDGKWRFEIPITPNMYSRQGFGEQNKLGEKRLATIPEYNKAYDEYKEWLLKEIGEDPKDEFAEISFEIQHNKPLYINSAKGERYTQAKLRYDTINDEYTAKYGDANNQPLTNMLRCPELYKAYPELKKVKVRFFYNINEGFTGYYNSTQPNVIYAFDSAVEDFTLKTIIHELQHWIQYHDNLAEGSVPELFEGINASATDAKDMYKRTAGEIEARDAAARIFITADERITKLPDVEQTDAIIIQNRKIVDALDDIDSAKNGSTQTESMELSIKDQVAKKFPDKTIKYSYSSKDGQSGTYLKPMYKEVLPLRKGGDSFLFEPEELVQKYGRKEFSCREITEYVLSKNTSMSEDEKKDMLLFLDDLCETYNAYENEYTYVGLKDVREATLDYRRNEDGEVVGLILRSRINNGEYAVNFDFSSICKKREAVTKILDALANRLGVNGNAAIDSLNLNQGGMDILRDIISKEGLETPCFGCFVESKRYNSQAWAGSFAEKFNRILARVVAEEFGDNAPEIKYLNRDKGRSTLYDQQSLQEEFDRIDKAYTDETQRRDARQKVINKFKKENKMILDAVASYKEENSKIKEKKRAALVDGLQTANISESKREEILRKLEAQEDPEEAKKEENKLTDAEKKLLQKAGLDTSVNATNEEKIENYIRAQIRNNREAIESGDYDNLLFKISPSDLITPKGIESLSAISSDLMGIISDHYGIGTPKMVRNFVPYNSELATIRFHGANAKEDLNKTLDFLYDIGGFRLQSFSDSRIQNMFDTIQMLCDAAANELPGHAYTKEIHFAKIVGMTGLKVNMSLMFNVDKDGNIDSDKVGLIKKKTSKTIERERLTEAVYALNATDEVKESIKKKLEEQAKKGTDEANEFTKEEQALVDEANANINAEKYIRGYGNGVLNEYDYMTADYEGVSKRSGKDASKRPLHDVVQSIGMSDAIKLQHQNGYTSNVGTIGVGFSKYHIIKMLRDPEIRQVIPYHKSGLPDIVSMTTQIGRATDYTTKQNTLRVTDYKIVDKNGEKVSAKDKAFDFASHYADLQKDINNISKVSAERRKFLREYCYAPDGTIAYGRALMQEFNDYLEENNLTINASRQEVGTGGFELYCNEAGERGKFRGDSAWYNADQYILNTLFEEDGTNKGQLPVFWEFAGEANWYKTVYDYNVVDNGTEQDVKDCRELVKRLIAAGRKEEALQVTRGGYGKVTITGSGDNFKWSVDYQSSPQHEVRFVYPSDVKDTIKKYMDIQNKDSKMLAESVDTIADQAIERLDPATRQERYDDAYDKYLEAKSNGDRQGMMDAVNEAQALLDDAAKIQHTKKNVKDFQIIKNYDYLNEKTGKFKSIDEAEYAERMSSDDPYEKLLTRERDVKTKFQPFALNKDGSLITIAEMFPLTQETFGIDEPQGITKNSYASGQYDSDGNALTQAQADYFADSKVRDKNGNLLVVYHGTDNEFFTFDKGKIGTGNGSSFGRGFYFTPSETLARNYSDTLRGFYINLQNPFDYFNWDKNDIKELLNSSNYEYDETALDNIPGYVLYDYDLIDEVLSNILTKDYADVVFSDMLQNAGYDGIMADNEIIAFEPEQIKSVSNTSPTSDQDIRYSFSSEGYRNSLTKYSSAMPQLERTAKKDRLQAKLDKATKENAQYKKAVKRLQKELQGKTDAKVKFNLVDKFSKQLIKKYGSRVNEDELTSTLTGMFNFLYDEMKNGSEQDFVIGVAEDYAYKVASKILNSAVLEDATKDKTYGVFWQTLSQLPVKVSADIRESVANTLGYENWESVVNDIGDKIRFGEEDKFRNLSDYYEDLAEMFPSLFPTSVMYLQDESFKTAALIRAALELEMFQYKNQLPGSEEEQTRQLALEIMLESLNVTDEAITDEVTTQDLTKLVQNYKKSVKEEYADKMLAYKNRLKDKQAEAKQSAKDTVTRNKIKQIVNRLNGMIKHPTENITGHIPPHLLQDVVKVLEAIDIPSEQREWYAKRLTNAEAILMDENKFSLLSGAERDELRKKIATYRKWQRNFDNGIASILDAYKKAQQNSSEADSYWYDEEAHMALRDISDSLRGRNLADLTGNELNDLYKAFRMLENEIANVNKCIIGQTTYELSKIAEGAEMATRKYASSPTRFDLANKYIMQMSRPEEFFRMLGGYAPQNNWNLVYQMFNEGEHKMNGIIKESRDIFEPVIGGDTKEERKLNRRRFAKYISTKEDDLVDVGIVDQDGKSFKMTHDMAVELYMNLTNGSNTRHIANGGLTLPESIEGLYKGNPDYRERRAEDINIDALKSKLDEVLDDYDKAWIACLKEYYDKYSKVKMDETSIELSGIRKAIVEHYYPIKTDGDFTFTDMESIKRDLNLSNSSITKERVEATNPIILQGAYTHTAMHINSLARYCGFAVAQKNFGKIFNFASTSIYEKDGEKFRRYETSLKKTIKSKFGNDAIDYIEHLMTNVVGGQVNPTGKAVARLKGNYARAILTLNPSVTLKQAASYPTAMAELGFSPAIRALFRPDKAGDRKFLLTKADKELIGKYTNLMWLRSEGQSTEELGDLAQTKGWMYSSEMSYITGWIQAVDMATVGRLWYACQEYVNDNNSDLEKYSDEYYKAVAEKFNAVVERTQPNYTMMQRSEFQRNGKEFTKVIFGMFKTQLIQNFNIFYGSINENRTLKENLKNANEEDKPALEKALKESGKKLANSMASLALANITVAAMTILAKALFRNMKPYRDKDTGEINAWSILGRLSLDTLSSAIGMFVGGSEAFEFITAAFSAVVKGKYTYYGVSDTIVESVGTATTDVLDVIANVRNLIAEDDEDDKGKLVDKLRDALMSSVADIFNVLGIPVGNAIKIGQAVGNLASDLANGRGLLQFVAGDMSTSTQIYQRAYNALVSGNDDKYEKAVALLKEQGYTDSQIQTRLQSLLSDEDGLQEYGKRYADGDISAIEEAINKYSQFEPSTVAGAVRNIGDQLNTYLTDDDCEQVVQNPSSASRIYSDAYDTLRDRGYSDNQANSKIKSTLSNYYKNLYKYASDSERENIRKGLENTSLFKPEDFGKWESEGLYSREEMVRTIETGDTETFDYIYEKNIADYITQGYSKADAKDKIKKSISSAYRKTYIGGDSDTKADIRKKLNSTGLFSSQDFADWNLSEYSEKAKTIGDISSNKAQSIIKKYISLYNTAHSDKLYEDNYKQAKSNLKGKLSDRFKDEYISASTSRRNEIAQTMYRTGLYDSWADLQKYLARYWK